MNHALPFALPSRRDRRGIALVITLLLLVLLSAFAVAFFTRMSVEQSSAASYSDGVTTRQLAESAVGLVQSQIRAATTVPNVAWASQPGMIRTYGKQGETGATAGKEPFAYYKLYSSNDMSLTRRDALDNFNPADEISQQWAKERALWVDMNEPVRLKVPDPNDDTSQITIERYPILDPRFAADSDMTNPTGLSMHNTTRDFKVEGFSIDSRDETTLNERGRMPVRWIYVLRDGSLTAPSRAADDGLKAIWEETGLPNAAVPSQTNPIVGRIAFWTDDDTSKVNINTAGGFTTKDIDPIYDPQNSGRFDLYSGGFWDTPRFFTLFDRGAMALDDKNFGEPKTGDPYSLSLSQPVTNEFQRYPGHPATTSLGLIFNRSLSTEGQVDPTKPRLSSQQLYRLLPRLMPGGTEGGVDRQLANNNAGDAYKDVSDSQMPLKSQRLYASVDEFFFAASQLGGRRLTINEFMRTGDTSDARNQIPGLTEDLLGAADLEEYQGYRFFLTAHNRAPELNLFGRPRVTIWPVWASGKQLGGIDYSSRRNPVDRLMMFSSTLGPLPPLKSDGTQGVGKLFMFQRWNPYSPYDDVNITRNQELLRTYLTGSTARPGLTDQPIPGFTDKDSFRTKYNGADQVGNRDQIITEIFDYIRSGVNLRDNYYNDEVNPNRIPYSTNNTIMPAATRLALDKQRYAPRGIVIPAAVSFPQSAVGASRGKEIAGFGRFPTVSEVSLVFYHAGYIGMDGEPYWDPRQKNTRGVRENLMRMFMVVETNNPMLGYSRTESFAGVAEQRDDRNPTPDRLTHIMQIHSAPGVTMTDGDGSNQEFKFLGGLLTNELLYYSGTFQDGSNAGGMEGVLHTLGTRVEEPGYAGADPLLIPPTPPSNNGTDAYPTGGGIYPFQSTNVVRVKLKAAVPPTPPSPGNPGNPGSPAREPQFCRFSGFDATLRIRWGQLELQFIDLKFPPIGAMPLPTDAYWEDPGGFGWPNTDIRNTPANYKTTWGGDRNQNNWPWASALLNHPAAMKSLAHRIWWVNCTFQGNDGRQRADSDAYGKYDAAGREIFDSRAGRGFRFDNRWRNIIQPGDVVRSLVPFPVESTDIRTVALARSKNNDTTVFKELNGYDSDPYLRHVQRLAFPPTMQGDSGSNTVASKQSQLLRAGSGRAFIFSGASTAAQVLAPSFSTACAIEPIRDPVPGGLGAVYGWARKSYGTVGGSVSFGNLAALPNMVNNKPGEYGIAAGDLPGIVNGVKRPDGKLGDFDTGFGARPDGSYVNKPDEGHHTWRIAKTLPTGVTADPKISDHWTYRFPYFEGDFNDEGFDSFFSPGRQLASPVAFGSLLVGPKTGWHTLCFSPNPMSVTTSAADHPGMTVEPKDHLLLDLFQMPVVEPYAITEPFSTAGKVNLNCEIMPFTYIRRTTALRAALHPVRVTAVNPNQVSMYKGQDGQNPRRAISTKQNYRLVINRDETLKGLTSIFDDTNLPVSDRFYKSASQICERFLYPEQANHADSLPGPKWNRGEAAIRAFWQANNLGGDNTREKPYSDLYPRLTTKSNTYTVHVRVQKLRPQKGTNPAAFLEFKETEDVIAAEYRGEVQIERFLDPQDPRFDLQNATIPADERFDVDATQYRATLPNTRPLEMAYRFRTVGSKRFAPDR